jgi:hypothetical protein
LRYSKGKPLKAKDKESILEEEKNDILYINNNPINSCLLIRKHRSQERIKQYP